MKGRRGKKTVLPSQIPKASLLKHSLPQGGGKRGRGKNRREEKKQRQTVRSEIVEDKREGKEEERNKGAGIPHWTE